MTSSSEDRDVQTILNSLMLGDSYYVDEQYEESLIHYGAAYALVRDGITPSYLSRRILNHRAATFLALNRYQDAYDDVREAIQYLPSLSSSSLSSSAAAASTPEPPAPLFQKGEVEMLYRRGGLACLGLKNYKDAKNYFTKAAELATLNHSSSVDRYPSWIAQCCSTDGNDDAESKSSAVVATDTTTTKNIPTPSSSSAAAAATTTPAAPTAVASSSSTSVVPTMPKYQYYQSDKFMTVSILEPNVRRDDLHVQLEPEQLTIVLTKCNQDFSVICGSLYQEIDVSKSKIVVKDEKVLVKLKKVQEQYEWPELIDVKKKQPPKPQPKKNVEKETPTLTTATATKSTDNHNPQSTAAATTPGNTAVAATTPATASSGDVTNPKPKKLNRPYASHKDWDAIEKDLAEEEEKEEKDNVGGDEAMNKLFQQIYSNASDDTRRAMVKSFQTSGGTVLSTNWDEVKDKDYEKDRTAPDGVEWKNWDGDKLPMSKDED